MVSIDVDVDRWNLPNDDEDFVRSHRAATPRIESVERSSSLVMITDLKISVSHLKIVDAPFHGGHPLSIHLLPIGDLNIAEKERSTTRVDTRCYLFLRLLFALAKLGHLVRIFLLHSLQCVLPDRQEKNA